MADKIVRQRVDDFDNSLDADHRVVFSIDDRWYRIDLTEEHRGELSAAIEPFTRVAEKIPTPPPGYRPTAANAASDAEIREWARGQGKEVSDRGRVPRPLIAEYYDAHR